MKIFIFGAGASRGSQRPVYENEQLNLRAPLVDELFERRYQDAANPVLPGHDFEECLSGYEKEQSVEKWLTKRWTDIDSMVTEASRQAERTRFGRICFYLRELLQRVSKTYTPDNGYRRLLHKLNTREEDFGLLTFNYDTLLDRAAFDVFGGDQTTLDGYMKYPLIKLHGSVNWFFAGRDGDPELAREFGSDRTAYLRRAAALMFNGANLLSMDTVEIIDPSNEKLLNNVDALCNHFSRSSYFYPLLLMPLTSKFYDMIKGFERKITYEAKLRIRDATDLYLIGYSANDDVFREMIVAAPEGTKVHVVGSGRAREVLDRVMSIQRATELQAGTVADEGFAKFVESY